jgi:glycosyltransferase involved in cell wall biosynthesis
MKILLIHNRYQRPGGEDTVFAAESAMLRQYGHDVVEYIDDNQFVDTMSKLSLAASTVWSRRSYSRITDILLQSRPSVVHFHNTFVRISPAAYYACQRLGVPVVQTLHNYRILCPNGFFFRDNKVCEDCLGKTPPWPGVQHACYRESSAQTAVVATMLTLHRMMKTWSTQIDTYIALSEFARQKFIVGGLPAEKIVVNPNFVFHDPGAVQNAGRYALFVGRLSPEKGVMTLLRAWRLLRGLPLKIVGDGPLGDQVRTFIEHEKLDQVELLGWKQAEAIWSLMKEAQFLVFPSTYYETFGMSMIEAFACGKPVITSRLGAMAEIVEENHTGLHFTPGDPADLAAKVAWAVAHPNVIMDMGQHARQRFETRYSPQQHYQRLMAIYDEAIERAKV